MENKTVRRTSPIVRSATYGYVVENFIGENAYTGEKTDYLTWRGGKLLIIPDWDTVPPKWRQYARPATALQAAMGERWPRLVRVVTETDLT